MIPAIVVYGLCMVTSCLCAGALIQQYRKTQLKLLFWSGVCFVGFALNNMLLMLDYLLPPTIDLSVARAIPALLGLMVMIIAFIQEAI